MLFLNSQIIVYGGVQHSKNVYDGYDQYTERFILNKSSKINLKKSNQTISSGFKIKQKNYILLNKIFITFQFYIIRKFN